MRNVATIVDQDDDMILQTNLLFDTDGGRCDCAKFFWAASARIAGVPRAEMSPLMSILATEEITWRKSVNMSRRAVHFSLLNAIWISIYLSSIGCTTGWASTVMSPHITEAAWARML